MSQPIEGYKSYIFKQILQDIKIVDYTESENLIKIRRVDDKSFRKVANKILICMTELEYQDSPIRS